MSGTLRITVLTGQDAAATCSIISGLASLPGIQVVGILCDSGRVSMKTRLAELWRNIRREGLSYIGSRIGDEIREQLERLAARVVSASEVSALLAAAFPGQALSLAQLAEQHQIPIFRVDTLNSPRAAGILRSLGPDLGVALGTRVLKRSTFSVPRMGCLNLHLGTAPEYRGMLPGFRELSDGPRTAGVTVHLIDDGSHTGGVVAEESITLRDLDTLTTLKRRLETCGRELLVRSVADFAKGRAAARPQPAASWLTPMSPTRRELNGLKRRLSTRRREQAPWRHAIKTACYLGMFYTGLPHLVRAARRFAGTSRGCVLLYHRVNDFDHNPLTTDVRRFAEHMVLLRNHYNVVPSSGLIDAIERRRPIPSTSVVIHFDDCYRDVATNAKPMLDALKFSASMFVASGYVSTQQRFPHDIASPWLFENLRLEDVRDLIAGGFEIGSHTVSHIDLGRASDETIAAELAQSKRDLEAIVLGQVVLFSFPFGRETNVRPGVEKLVRDAGYRAMFSAHGGYVTGTSSLFELPRVGVGGATRPLDLLMEIEGLSAGVLLKWWKRRRTWRRVRKTQRESIRGRSTARAPLSGGGGSA
jgi:peptidoglycan/xylan/chitin deacetylase (PgdA/CDA1 family)/folate-dependent phosphoribosylglycinamide formyltransferase PurN